MGQGGLIAAQDRPDFIPDCFQGALAMCVRTLVTLLLFSGRALLLAQTAPVQEQTTEVATRRTPPGKAAITNADVVKMVKAGLAADVVASAIQQAGKVAFDLSPDGLISLKTAHVPDTVITAMQRVTVSTPAQGSPGSASPPVLGSPIQVTVPGGTEVKLHLSRALSSDVARKGDRVDFETISDVSVDGRVVIKKGAAAWGKITDATSQRLVRAGHLDFTVDSVKAINDDVGRLRFSQSVGGGRLVGVKGKEATIPAGTEFTAALDGDWQITLSAAWQAIAAVAARPASIGPASIGSSDRSDAPLPATKSFDTPTESDSGGSGRRARRERAVVESGKAKSVGGGSLVKLELPYDKAYEAVLTFLKKQGMDIDAADRDAGRIVTAMSITGGHHQTGTRTQVTLIKENDAATSVRLAVTTQMRYKALQTEPWSDAKVDETQTGSLITALEGALR